MRPVWSRRLPILFLLLSLGVAGVGALEALRAHRSSRQTADSVLRDYGAFAAWSYQQRLEELVSSSVYPGHLAIARQNRIFEAGQATEQCLEQILIVPPADTCGCGPSVTGDYSFFVPFEPELQTVASRAASTYRPAMWSGKKPTQAVRERVIAAVREHGRSQFENGRAFALVHLPADEGIESLHFAYTLIERPVGGFSRDTIAYGMEVDPQKLASLFEFALDEKQILPPSLTQSQPNSAVVAVQVIDPNGNLLYESSPEFNEDYAAKAWLRPGIGGGFVRASVLPTAAEKLIIGGLPTNRTPLLLLLFGTATALAVLAVVQARREDRLAALRQDFVASVSHELRTPLAQVRLFAETLRLGRVETDEQRDWALDNIERETHRLGNLVENILHFSRAERGIVPALPELGDLGACVEGAVASYQRLVPNGKATIETDVTDGLNAEFHADSMRQVVANLLDNAVRYGPVGQHIRVAVFTRGDSIHVVVEDEGPGVPADERTAIFEPFRRGAGNVGSVAVGSGIGLSVVKGIVEAHGGAIFVDAASGGGARFTVTLPSARTASPRAFASDPVPTAAPRSEIA